MATTPSRQPVAPKYFENEYTAIVFVGSTSISDTKPGTNVP